MTLKVAKLGNTKFNCIAFVLCVLIHVHHCFEFKIGPLYFKNGVHMIQKGTKWCGNGDIADNYDDLGKYRTLDACCRAHDKCTDDIAPGETKYGLTNKHPFYMSHCDCDMELYTCLNDGSQQDVDASENKEIQGVGNEFFNTLDVQCFNYTSPATCVKNQTQDESIGILPFKSTKCIHYAFDVNAEKQWQWFDVPFFTIND